MTEDIASVERERETLENLPGAACPELLARRVRGARLFSELGVPGRRSEAWKYTPLEGLSASACLAFATPKAPTERRVRERAQELPRCQGLYRMVFAGGSCAVLAGTKRPLPKGVRLLSLAGLLEEEPELALKHLGCAAPDDGQPFVALNSALMQNGFFLHLSRGTVLEEPLNLVFFNAVPPPGGLHLRNLVVLEEGSQATIVESHHAGGEGPSLTNLVTEVRLGAGASLKHRRLQQESSAAWHLSWMGVRAGRESSFSSLVVSLGASLSRNEISVLLAEEGARTELLGLYLGSGARHLDNQLLVDHACPRTTSRVSYRGILDDRSTGVFSGRALVRQDAQQADASQMNRNLLLSREATVDSRPQLEIYADDVTCTHGVTTGRLDQESLFYLRSRGLPVEEARRMLTMAFAQELLEGLEEESVAKHFREAVVSYLKARKGLQEA